MISGPQWQAHRLCVPKIRFCNIGGEVRELFVFLDDEDICEMLDVRDAQIRLSKDDEAYFENDPTVVLDQKIYDFLGGMPR